MIVMMMPQIIHHPTPPRMMIKIFLMIIILLMIPNEDQIFKACSLIAGICFVNIAVGGNNAVPCSKTHCSVWLKSSKNWESTKYIINCDQIHNIIHSGSWQMKDKRLLDLKVAKINKRCHVIHSSQVLCKRLMQLQIRNTHHTILLRIGKHRHNPSHIGKHTQARSELGKAGFPPAFSSAKGILFVLNVLGHQTSLISPPTQSFKEMRKARIFIQPQRIENLNVKVIQVLEKWKQIAKQCQTPPTQSFSELGQARTGIHLHFPPATL